MINVAQSNFCKALEDGNLENLKKHFHLANIEQGNQENISPLNEICLKIGSAFEYATFNNQLSSGLEESKRMLPILSFLVEQGAKTNKLYPKKIRPKTCQQEPPINILTWRGKRGVELLPESKHPEKHLKMIQVINQAILVLSKNHHYEKRDSDNSSILGVGLVGSLAAGCIAIVAYNFFK